MIDKNFKIFIKNERVLIKRKKENKLITYEGKPLTFKTLGKALLMAEAITTGNKHDMDNLGYWPSKIK